MAKSGYKGVSRIDSPAKKMHGWYVRVRFDNTTRAKFLSDKQYGGREEALQKAVECRNELERELGKPRTDCVIVGSNPRNATGVTGVRRTAKKHHGKDGKIYLNEVYEVTWNAGREKKGRTSVSIKKYGEAAAFRRACGIRRRMEQLMYGAPVEAKWVETLSKLCAA